MDFGVMGLDGLMVGSCSEQAGLCSSSSSLCLDPETKQHKWYGSGLFLNKQERSENNNCEDDWKTLKVAKTNEDDFSASKAAAMLFLDHQQRRSPSVLRSSNNNSLFSADSQQQQQQMLSFSPPKSEAMLLRNESGSAYPYSAYTNRNTGYNSGSFNAASMHGLLAGVRGPFTPSQWMELEHQALIYKYINANVPIPSNLLIPIKKALDSAGFSTFSGIPLRPNPLGWGSFHLGFSNSTDPEPGRCRRTDGKKWRCSRDAVADQKYCERHMNRGRHRSRKPVEGQTGHSVASTITTNTNTTTTKLMSIPSSSSASVVIGGGAGSGMTTNHQQVKHLQPGASNTSAATHIKNRIFMNKENLGERVVDTPVLSMLSSPTTSNLNSKHNSFSIPKQQQQRMPFDESSSRTDFGLISSDDLLNPSSNKSYTFMNSRNYAPSKDLNNNERASELQNPLHHFMDDWPKNQPETSSMSWPADIGMQSDRTQLSISIPLAAYSDFMSSTTSSPTIERPTLSPLRLSREFNSTTTQMGLGVGAYNEENHRQANWIPISWETSMGGPLGEVLHNTSNTNKIECKNTSALNLMTEGWENGNSPRLGSSPTGVLQKTAFGSLSNSSAGSSPRAENNNNNNNKKTHEGSSLCNNDLGMIHRENEF